MVEMYRNVLKGSEQLSGLTDVDEVLKALSRLLKKLVKSQWTAVYFFDRERRDFSPAHSFGLPVRYAPLFREMPLYPDKIPLIRGILSKKQHLMITDTKTSELLPIRFRRLLANVHLLAVPLSVRNEVVGVAFLARRCSHKVFSPEEIAVIKDLVSHAALVVSHMRLFDESLDMALDLAGRIDVILTIDEINKAISSTLSRDKILETAIRHIERITRSEIVSILQVEGKSLVVMASHSGKIKLPKLLLPGNCPITCRCVFRSAWDKGTTVRVGALDEQKRPAPVEKALVKAGIRSVFAVPLLSKGVVTGILILGDTERGKFAKEETFTVEKIASQMAVALENARLYEDMRSLFINTVSSLANAIDAKSPWTKGHSERVMHISVNIAKEMGLDELTVERIRLGGLLHDLGKIGIIEALLDKPEKLSEDEFPPMRLHPEKGVAILAPIKQLQDVLPIILHHHEHLDGSGYPDGLKGEAIPLEARIVAVADAFDAIISERPYKKSLSVSEAFEELRNEAGSHFDPEIIEVYYRYVQRVMHTENQGSAGKK